MNFGKGQKLAQNKMNMSSGSHVLLWGKGWEGGEVIFKWKPECYHQNTGEWCWVIKKLSSDVLQYHWFESPRREECMGLLEKALKKKLPIWPWVNWPVTEIMNQNTTLEKKNIYNYTQMQNKTAKPKGTNTETSFHNTSLNYCLWKLWHLKVKGSRECKR